jgi:hypothetical protein
MKRSWPMLNQSPLRGPMVVTSQLSHDSLSPGTDIIQGFPKYEPEVL